MKESVRQKVKLANDIIKMAWFTPESTHSEGIKYDLTGFRYDERSTRENVFCIVIKL